MSLPGPSLRGRITLTSYRQLGVPDLIATDAADFVAKALRLAQDRPWHEALSARILAGHAGLFETMGAVRELEGFLAHACRAGAT